MVVSKGTSWWIALACTWSAGPGSTPPGGSFCRSPFPGARRMLVRPVDRGPALTSPGDQPGHVRAGLQPGQDPSSGRAATAGTGRAPSATARTAVVRPATVTGLHPPPDPINELPLALPGPRPATRHHQPGISQFTEVDTGDSPGLIAIYPTQATSYPAAPPSPDAGTGNPPRRPLRPSSPAASPSNPGSARPRSSGAGGPSPHAP